MSKFSKLFSVAFMVIVLLCVSVLPCFGAVNNEEAPVGSTVEYTISIADCVQNITGIHLEVLFDQTKLELKDVSAPNLGAGVTINKNENKDGAVRLINGMINGEEGLACKEKTELVKVTFEVIAEGDSEIKYYIPYLYDFEMVNIYKYTITQTIGVDGEVVVDNVPPVLASEEDFSNVKNFDMGDFKNYPEGTGSGVKELPEEVTTPDEVADEKVEEEGNNVPIILIFAGIIAAVVIVLVIVKVAASKKQSK